MSWLDIVADISELLLLVSSLNFVFLQKYAHCLREFFFLR